MVYKIACDGCDASYVGETERKLSTRFKEHHRSSSPVGHHVEFNKHSVSDASVSVLHKESDWFRRGVAEAIHIDQHSPILNRGRERHNLPKIYQQILPTPHSALSRDVDYPSHVTNTGNHN